MPYLLANFCRNPSLRIEFERPVFAANCEHVLALRSARTGFPSSKKTHTQPMEVSVLKSPNLDGLLITKLHQSQNG